MKILYNQNSSINAISTLSTLNIKNCYLKEILYKNDYKKTTHKSHSHTEYEIHMIFQGTQSYNVDGVIFDLNENELIIIPPKIKHRMTFASENLLKYAISFTSDDIFGNSPYHGTITESIINNISFIADEFRQKQAFTFSMIENRVFEIFVFLNRIIGNKKINFIHELQQDNSKLELAKKFITDNIERNLSVTDVALYCHISPRQLTRNFIDNEGISPAKYINTQKMIKISEYIKNSDLSLQQISEKFSYNNEYYFNTAFKKYFGMPPFSYRKMFR